MWTLLLEDFVDPSDRAGSFDPCEGPSLPVEGHAALRSLFTCGVRIDVFHATQVRRPWPESRPPDRLPPVANLSKVATGPLGDDGSRRTGGAARIDHRSGHQRLDQRGIKGVKVELINAERQGRPDDHHQCRWATMPSRSPRPAPTSSTRSSPRDSSRSRPPSRHRPRPVPTPRAPATTRGITPRTNSNPARPGRPGLLVDDRPGGQRAVRVADQHRPRPGDQPEHGAQRQLRQRRARREIINNGHQIQVQFPARPPTRSSSAGRSTTSRSSTTTTRRRTRSTAKATAWKSTS